MTDDLPSSSSQPTNSSPPPSTHTSFGDILNKLKDVKVSIPESTSQPGSLHPPTIPADSPIPTVTIQPVIPKSSPPQQPDGSSPVQPPPYIEPTEIPSPVPEASRPDSTIPAASPDQSGRTDTTNPAASPDQSDREALTNPAAPSAVNEIASLRLKKANEARSKRRMTALNKVIVYVQKNGNISNKKVRDLLHIGQTTATEYLTELVKKGLLKLEKKSNQSYYHF